MSDSPSENNAQNSTYPVQHHAGKVGYGPNYHTEPTLVDKIAGYTEELRGKVVHNPELVKEGHDRATGELLRKQRLELNEENPLVQQAQSPKSDRPQMADSSQSSERESIKPESTASSQGKEKSSSNEPRRM